MVANIEDPSGLSQFISEERIKTMMVWANPTLSGVGTAFGLGNTGQSSYLALGCRGAQKDVFFETSAGGDSFAPGEYTSGWNLVIGQIEPANNAQAYLNGSLGAGATACHEGALTTLTVGALELSGSILSHFEGELEHVAGWSVGLTNEEMKKLHEGANPSTIRPESLVYYWTLEGTNSEHEPSFKSHGPELAVGNDVGIGTTHAPVEPAEEKVVKEAGGAATGEGVAHAKCHIGNRAIGSAQGIGTSTAKAHIAHRTAGSAVGTGTAHSAGRVGRSAAGYAHGEAVVTAKGHIGHRSTAVATGRGVAIAKSHIRKSAEGIALGRGIATALAEGPHVESSYGGLTGGATFAPTPGSTYGGLGGDSDYNA